MDHPPPEWIAYPDGSGVVDEYAAALSAVVIAPHLMATSRLQRQLARLDAHIAALPLASSLEETVAALVQTAFALPSPGAAHTHHGATIGGDYAHFYADATALVGGASAASRRHWHAALRLLGGAATEDRDALQQVCSLLSRAHRECEARKRDVFNVVIERAVGHLPPEKNEVSAVAVGDAAALPATSRLLEGLRLLIDDFKERAFRTAFLEPTALHFRFVRDHVSEGDVDVHGANTYAALLQAAVGVRLPRLPLLNDECKAVAPFRNATAMHPRFIAALAALEQPANFGAPSSSIPACCALLTTSGYGGGGRLFPWGCTAASAASSAVMAGAASRAHRNALAPYVSAFTRWFESPFVLQRLCASVMADDALAADAQAVFEALVREDGVVEGLSGQCFDHSDGTDIDVGGTAHGGSGGVSALDDGPPPPPPPPPPPLQRRAFPPASLTSATGCTTWRRTPQSSTRRRRSDCLHGWVRVSPWGKSRWLGRTAYLARRP